MYSHTDESCVDRPAMPKAHRPDVEAIHTDPANITINQLRHHDAFMWPMINLTDLVDDWRLLQLLNARSRHHPVVFAHSDLGRLEVGKNAEELPEYHIVELGQSRETSIVYGCSIGGQDKFGKMDELRPGVDLIPAGDFLLLMEAQAGLLKFLIDFCKASIPYIEIRHGDFPPVGPLHSPAPKDTDRAWDITTESLYIAPTQCCMDELEHLVAARLEEARHELLALREDPGFLIDYINKIQAYLPERIPDAAGRVHLTSILPAKAPEFWSKVTTVGVLYAMVDVEFWAIFNNLLTDFIKCHLHTKDVPSTFSNEENLVAIRRLKRFMQSSGLDILSVKLMNTFVSSPEMAKRKVVIREDIGGGRCRLSLDWTQRKLGVTDSGPFYQLIQLLPALSRLLYCRGGERTRQDVVAWSALDFGTLATELLRCMEDERDHSRTPSRVSERAHHVATDIGLVGQIHTRLAQMHPFYFSPSDLYHEAWLKVDAELHIKETLDAEMSLIRLLWKTWGDYSENGAQEYPMLWREDDHNAGQFDLPSSRMGPKASNQKVRKAEQYQDEIFQKLDHHVCQIVLGHLPKRSLMEAKYAVHVPKPGSLQRTPPWEPPPGSSTRADVPGQILDSETQPFRPDANLAPLIKKMALEERSKKLAKEQKKQAKDGHNIQAQNAEESAEVTAPEPLPPRCRHMWDMKRTKHMDKAVSSLFDDKDQSSGVAWKHFKTMMEAIGFVAKPNGGSSWSFGPGPDASRWLTSAGLVHFHMPHPDPKIEKVTARAFGKRLTRRYGIDLSNFKMGEGAEEG